MPALGGIEHVVVLMLENRSFDCMLGTLYPPDPGFEGLRGDEQNLWMGQRVKVWRVPGDTLDARSATIPSPDPGELFADMTMQIFGSPPGPTPSMSGFVENYMRQQPTPPDCRAPMHYFTPEQVPVLSALARAFGVCDQWHASAPCQTWPNRFFVHSGTCLGHVDNANFPFPYTAPSIFRRMSERGRSWRVYFHDVPHALMLADIWSEAPLHFRYFSAFLADSVNGTLPNYSFIEPRYFTDLFLNNIPNDEHPPHNVLYGEALIASVYNAVRASPSWKKTLLVITCDEHGGCFDHVPPPAAVPPDDRRPDGFAFDRYGVRVPTIIVSPYMAPGSRVRAMPTGLPSAAAPYPFDHTSILATLRKLFDLGPPLTRRDAAAPDLLGALSLDEPQNDGPARISAEAARATIAQLEARGAAPPNHMQAALSRMAAQLPPRPPAPGEAPPPPAPLGAPVPDTVAKAHAASTLQARSFLGL
ncbi:MAG TPA: alkaline phosphatase family protein [Stellaceae bacterium]|nr:alkaline phosphatase family protein [Stellaceae bacterium]